MKKNSTFIGEYVSPNVQRNDIRIENGFASSIAEAGSEDYGEFMSLNPEEVINI